MPECDPQTITRLRDLWSQGLTTAVIGQRLSISKNAVVGKAHRLNLAARPSPIRKAATPDGAPRIANRCLVPPNKTLTGSLLGIEGDPAPQAVIFVPLTPSVIAKVDAAPKPDHPPRCVVSSLSRRQCSWPIGDPGKPSFHFCISDAAGGKPYCPEHCGIAYKPRPTRFGCNTPTADQEQLA